MADDEVVLYEVRDGGVALLTLNRPERFNAWTLEMEDRYFELLQQADADPRSRPSAGPSPRPWTASG